MFPASERTVPHWVVIVDGGYFWSTGHAHGHWADKDADVRQVVKDFLHVHPEHESPGVDLEYWTEWRKPIKTVRFALR